MRPITAIMCVVAAILFISCSMLKQQGKFSEELPDWIMNIPHEKGEKIKWDYLEFSQ